MDRKPLPEDFRDFIHSLNKNNVRYLLVGGWAVGLYGNPRATKDIDFFIAVDEMNLDNLKKALLAFGSPPVDLSQFKEPGRVFRMGRSPIQIEIINTADGLDFQSAYDNRNTLDIDGVLLPVISKRDLIANKRASGRLKDLADVEGLEE